MATYEHDVTTLKNLKEVRKQNLTNTYQLKITNHNLPCGGYGDPAIFYSLSWAERFMHFTGDDHHSLIHDVSKRNRVFDKNGKAFIRINFIEGHEFVEDWIPEPFSKKK